MLTIDLYGPRPDEPSPVPPDILTTALLPTTTANNDNQYTREEASSNPLNSLPHINTTSYENNSSPIDSSLESSAEDLDLESTDHEEIAPPSPNHLISQMGKNKDSNLVNQTNTPVLNPILSLKFHPI
ncbi:hypothetical protein HAX54_023933 [Datura stramonium]|uniref:Uncharacterized protein n=1 Tax=Datura stramonium TaxID=4076 RepID=A0ABS8UX37_DATST|nr:hypothetical protein [Datura stramonium]